MGGRGGSWRGRSLRRALTVAPIWRGRSSARSRSAQIVVLSDGMNNQGARPVIDVVERYQKQRTRIDAVGLGHEHDRELLTRVAGQTGSVYRQE